jgi:hypothetical protein
VLGVVGSNPITQIVYNSVNRLVFLTCGGHMADSSSSAMISLIWSPFMKNDLILFEDYKVRRLYDEETETWYFSVIDIVQILTQQPEFQTARNYWNVLKTRLKKEGSQSLTNCKRLKLEAADGKKYLTEALNATG